ncbi:MAG: anti-sigma factor [Anaerolineae bacterium]|nr:anti-sigma factor [Anaerolineae bacterium]
MNIECDRIRELLAAYAVGALDPDEQSFVDEHVAGCADCSNLLIEYRDVIATLPEIMADVSPHDLPDTLKTSVLQQLGPASDEVLQIGQVNKEFMPMPRPSVDSRSRSSWNQSRVPGKQATRRGWRIRIAALGLALLMVLLIGWSVQLQAALARERALRVEFADLVDQQEVVLEVVDSDKTIRRVLLAPEPRQDSALPPYGKLFTRSDLTHVVAMVARLPQPQAGEGYHLWLTNNGQTELAGILKINDDGFALLVFDADQNGPVYDTARLTLQPLNSEFPADDTILQWEAAP